jgi:hypothetical protein
MKFSSKCFTVIIGGIIIPGDCLTVKVALHYLIIETVAGPLHLSTTIPAMVIVNPITPTHLPLYFMN